VIFIMPSQIADLFKTFRRIEEGPGSDSQKIEEIWGYSLIYRTVFLRLKLAPTFNNEIIGGPFAGMKFDVKRAGAPAMGLFLGTYEHELHHFVRDVIANPPDRILNIGCADGFYAVGFARTCPNTKVFAYDILEKAKENCRYHAEINGVSERVIIDGIFNGSDFETAIQGKTLIICDIEGGEEELLDPARYPALCRATILVEMHDCIKKGLSDLMQSRFKDSHHMEIVQNIPITFALEKIYGPHFLPLDGAVAAWDGRGGPTPWGIFRPKN
jgi:hypothetical protein